ncbi:MAG: T9SS type A sorting domain-containing protein [Ignavibacteriaceae bacterium]
MIDLKAFLVFNLIIIFSFSAMAQSLWVLQHAAGLPQSSNPQILFSAVDKNICWGCNYINSQFVRTTDGGATWRVYKIEEASGSICAGISALDSSTAWIAVINPGGIFKTTDGGLTWVKDTVAFIKTKGRPNGIHFFDYNNGVCVGNLNNGYWEIYTTSDGGANWVRVNSANIPAPVSSTEAGGKSNVVPIENLGVGNNYWFGTYSGSLYKTTDRGATWTVTHSVITSYPFSYAFKDSLNGVACSFLDGKKISVTSDGGHTWQPVNVTFNSPTPFGVMYIKGTDNGYLLNSSFHNGTSEPTNAGSAYSSDGGKTWAVIDNTSNLYADFAQDGTGWSGGEGDLIYKWIAFSKKKIVAIQPYIDKIFAMKNVDSVLFRTAFLDLNNHQFTAKLIYTNSDSTLTDSLTLYDDGYHGDSQPNDGLYGVYIPPMNVEDYFKLNVSTTEDLTNKYINTPMDLRFTSVGPIKLDSLSISQISTTTYNIKSFFKNEGSSYTVNDIKVKISTNYIAIKQIVPDTINISSIAPKATAETTDDVNITVDSRFNGLFKFNFEIMSDGWTYWKDTVSQVATGINEKILSPIDFSLSQNYPNPFNPNTTINFIIPKSSFVNLSVYDILGRKISTLVNEEKTAGNYKVDFNAINLPSGIYFYNLQAGSLIKSKKMILLK